MKKIIILSVISAMLAGCQPDFQESRKKAYERWYAARAQMLCGVIEDSLKDGKINLAASKAREAKALAPHLVQARILLGRAYIEQGSFAAAVEELKEAVKLQEKDPKAWYFLGVAQEKNDLPKEAMQSYAKAYELDDYYSDAIIAKAQVLVETSEIKSAKELMGKYLHVYRHDRASVELYGRIALLDKDYQTAAKAYRISTELGPNHKNRIMLAQALMNCESYDKAEDEINILLDTENYQADSWTYDMLGDCYIGMADFVKAREAFVKACQINPQLAAHWTKLAQANLLAGDLDSAIKNANQALKLSPNNLSAAIVKSLVEYRSGKTALAINTLKPIIEKYPKDPSVLCIIGKCHETDGRIELAKDYYNKALKYAPNNNIAQILADK